MRKTVVNLSNITTVILAGGLGTRLRPVVADRPKVLAKVRERPFLTYLLDQLSAVGIREVVLSTGYMGEQVNAEFGDVYSSLCLIYSHESSPLGTAGALRLALPLLKSDSVLVMNGDSFCEADLRSFWAWHRACNAKATLILAHMSDTNRYGRVHVDAEGAVVSFDEKNGTSGKGWVNAGVYLLTRSLISTIRAKGPVSLEREIFPAWIGQGLYGYRTEGRFLDIGTSEGYAIAEQFFDQKTLT